MAIVEKKLSRTSASIDTCPTCGAELIEGEYESGTYRLRGETYKCDCEEQVMLYKHYLLADIPLQYMRLDWRKDYRGDLNLDQIYLDKWKVIRASGMGLEFGSKQQGVGKTFAATHIGKELVKRRVPVLFMPFTNVIDTLESGSEDEDAIRETEVLILDEVVPPRTVKSSSLFSNRFEAVIRHRTNWNLPTIMTTNMTEAELQETYARTYSLLSAKQVRIDMTGEDARRSFIGTENLDIIVNDEIRPIS